MVVAGVVVVVAVVIRIRIVMADGLVVYKYGSNSSLSCSVSTVISSVVVRVCVRIKKKIVWTRQKKSYVM